MTYYAAIRQLKKDQKLRDVITQVGKFQLKITKNRYKSLVEAIATQQLTGSAAKSILNKFTSMYDNRFPKPIDVIITSNKKLQNTGLSRMKVLYIKELSKKIESRELNFKKISKLSDEEVVSELTKIKGIGRWTAEMFLIFSLGRLDVFPTGDLGLKKGIQLLYSMSELPQPPEMVRIAEKWRPYRTIATWYLWKSLKKFDTIG